MAFTEFCCRSGGSNLNGGHLNSNLEPATGAVYSTTNGGWNGTTTFTPTDGSTPANTVTVGDFASVYLDGATVAVYIARVTTVNAGVNGTIILSSTAKAGSAPTSLGSGRSINVGGAWKGPNAAEGFPFTLIHQAATNVAGDFPRVNYKNDAQYNIIAGISVTNANCIHEGYTGSFGDGGRAVIDGGTSGASYVLLTDSVANSVACYKNIIFQNNGATGNANGALVNGGRSQVIGCVFNNVMGFGLSNSAGNNIIECEAYACNKSNTATTGGFLSGASYVRCISHDNSGSNSVGFDTSANTTYIGCIADTNGSHGFSLRTAGAITVINCDAYNNGGAGFFSNAQTSIYYANCNSVKNATWGIDSSGTIGGHIHNCAFGAGTQANASGQTRSVSGASGNLQLIQIITYANDITPWVDPANGDFRINVTAAKGTGRGTFTETASSYAGTVGYPDVGAGQHQETAAGGLLTHPGMAGGMRS
jgi:parallel beta-helix repeat protein